MSLIRHTFTLVRPVLGAVAIFAFTLSFISGTIPTAFAVDNENKVTICHATGNGNYQSVPASMTADAGGHYGQNHQDGMDIIPEFDYPAQGNNPAGHFDGQNWNADGQAIWNNGCEPVPDPVVGCMDDSYDNYDPLATEDTDPSSCANEDEDEDKCEIEGHKYTLDSERNAIPLSDWVIGLMKIRTYEDESSNTFDLDSSTTDEDGYYCLEWDGEAGLPEGEETTPYKSFVYYVYEVLVAGWTNISIEKGTDVASLKVVPAEEILETPVDRVSTQVFEENGYLPANAAYHVDFYNIEDGDDGDDGDDDGEPTYTIDGYKWNDADNNKLWGDTETTLPGWTIEVTNGEDTFSTTTDANGYYWFEVPAGNWTVREVQQSGWTQTYPDPQSPAEGMCSVEFGVEDEVSEDSVDDDADDTSDDTSDDTTSDFECVFGNHADGNSDGRYTLNITITGEGEGNVTDEGEGNGITCLSTTLEGQEVSNDCSETYLAGTEVTLIATPDEGSNFDNSWTVGAGSCTGNTTPCKVTMNSNLSLTAHFDLDSSDGGGSSSGSKKRSSRNTSSNEPTGEVLGESTNALPVGAPNTGAGGTSGSPVASLAAFFGMLMSLVAFRITKHVA